MPETCGHDGADIAVSVTRPSIAYGADERVGTKLLCDECLDEALAPETEEDDR